LIVNGGALKALPPRLYQNKLVKQNTKINILKSMYLQISRDFANVPPINIIEDWQIFFYYEALIPELIKYQKDAKK
jgi:hypothetical protein